MSTKLRHALIDVSFFADDRIIELGEIHGDSGQLYLIKLLLLMSGTSGGVISRVAALGLRGSLSKTKATEIILFCLEKDRDGGSILCAVEDTHLTNSRVQRDQRARDLARDRQEKKRDKDRDESVTTGVTTPGLPVSVSDTDHVFDSSNWICNSLEWAPAEFEILKIWVEHRKKRKKPLSDFEIEVLMKNWNHDRAGFVRMVKHHVNNGHVTLYAENASNPAEVLPKNKFKSRAEKWKEEMEEIDKL